MKKFLSDHHGDAGHPSLGISILAATASLVLAGVTPAQAQLVGFGNIRIEADGVVTPLVSANVNNPIPITSSNGSYTVKADLYTANGVTLPANFQDTFRVSLNDFGGTNTIPDPVPSSKTQIYTGGGTLANPIPFSYAFNSSPGTYNGLLSFGFDNSNNDYDANRDGTFENSGAFSAVRLQSQAVPFEPSPTLGLLLLGGIWGVNSHLKKKKLALTKISDN